MMPSTAIAVDKSHRRRTASLSLLCVLLLGYAVIYFVDYDDAVQRPRSSTTPARRSLQLANRPFDSRLLAKNADSPSPLDVIPGEYIVKPWVGSASIDVWETNAQTRLKLAVARSSSTEGNNVPRHALRNDEGKRWKSERRTWYQEWLVLDMGGPQNVAKVYIQWGEDGSENNYAVDFKVQVAMEQTNCRPNGNSCAASWTTVDTVTGKNNYSPTTTVINDPDYALQGVRYVRILCEKKVGNSNDYYNIYNVRIYRKKMIVGDSPTGTSCGSTLTAATNSLLSQYGGTLIQAYENAEFFSASMTSAQKDAMFEDDCVFTVEPNYIVRARGRTTKRIGADVTFKKEVHARRLAIPEFNLQDENPPNWGLERVSSYGRLNGYYKWTHEGMNTHMYIFDTGIYPDHSDWIRSDLRSRIGEGLICTGTATDYTTTNHGTHVASIAAGKAFGIAKSTTIHPIQVLDTNGEGSTASLLCGMEKLLADGIAYNAANAPNRIQAVVNLSLGVEGRSDALDKAVKDMTDLGYAVVIAAGDYDDNACFYSPYDPTAITVGALSNDELGKNSKTSSSNYGECIDIWAPGEDILGASNLGEFESVSNSGTSVAAAFVAGIATLHLETVNSQEHIFEDYSTIVKDKLISQGERDALDDIGYGSVNKIAQTTASRCSGNSGGCGPDIECVDGVCFSDAQQNLMKGTRRRQAKGYKGGFSGGGFRQT